MMETLERAKKSIMRTPGDRDLHVHLRVEQKSVKIKIKFFFPKLKNLLS